ncbi:DNA packaging tegument protein UL17 [Equid gammaherpesvirus 2]|nr:DNA packaging tegument protein UL17 [Equid gammaherpesvirus 2]
MDVHLGNWRLCGRRCGRLAHVVLPEAFLDRHGLAEDAGAEFFVQTRFTGSLRPSSYVRVIGAFFGGGSGDEIARRDRRSALNLVLSLPLLADGDGRYDPHNIATLKVRSGDGRHLVFVDFFYLSLLGPQMPRGPESEGEGGKDGGAGRGDGEASRESPLERIAAEASGPGPGSGRGRSAGGRRASPLSVLSGLLDNKYTQIAKHHRALEDPGAVRGVNIEPDRRDHGNLAGVGKRKVRCALNLIDLKRDDITFTSSTHLLSGTRFTLCHYPRPVAPRGGAPWESTLDGLSERQLRGVDPLAALILGFDFLERAQTSLVNSLARECENGGLKIFQRLPVCVEKKHDIRGVLGDHFTEACHVLARQVGESCAWVRACVSGERGHVGLWADFLNLWEAGPSTLGVDLSYLFSPGPPDDESAFWARLLGSDRLLDAIKTGARAVLVVDSQLAAWLLLPGGFAIKGRYSLSREDIKITVGRYG